MEFRSPSLAAAGLISTSRRPLEHQACSGSSLPSLLVSSLVSAQTDTVIMESRDSEEQEILISPSSECLADVRVFPLICHLNKDVSVSAVQFLFFQISGLTSSLSRKI